MLPTQTRPEGSPPDPQPYFAPKLAEAWAAELGDQSRTMALPEARIRHSWAGMCARKIGYMMTSTPETNPADIAAYWVMGLGTIVHERWQDVMQKTFPTAEVEKACWIEESKSAGHIDLFVPREELMPSTALELKTIGGYGAKLAVGARGPAEGPRASAFLQGALNGLASSAERIVIVLLFTENMSPREASKLGAEPWRKFSAEWSYTDQQFLPVALREVSRFAKIIEIVDRGDLPPRAVPVEMPLGARIMDPTTGAWTLVESEMVVQAGSYWGCGYCSYRDQCVADG